MTVREITPQLAYIQSMAYASIVAATGTRAPAPAPSAVASKPAPRIAPVSPTVASAASYNAAGQRTPYEAAGTLLDRLV
jgi:hypothetical protein